MAEASDFSERRTIVWKTRITDHAADKVSSSFSLLGATWQLVLSRDFRGIYLPHFTVSLRRIGNEHASTRFSIITLIQKSECLIGDVQFKGYCKRDIVEDITTLIEFGTDRTSKNYLYVQNGTEVSVVCIFPDMPWAASEVLNRTVEPMTNTDSDYLLPVKNIRAVKLSSDECEQGSSSLSSNLDSLSRDLGKLLENKVVPDVNLKCGDRMIAAHKAILAARSQVFSAMFQSKMLESETGVVDIADVEAQVLEMFLKYVYSGRLTDVPDELLPSLYASADKYAVGSLETACSERMISNLTRENCLNILLLADAHRDQYFKNAIFNFILNQIEMLKSEEWAEFSKENPALSNEVFQFVVQRKLF